MQSLRLIFVSFVASLLLASSAWALPSAQWVQKTVNTDATDFTVVTGVSGRQLHITQIHVQNIGTTNKVTVEICDGTCDTAANQLAVWELSKATADGMGGGWSLDCGSRLCEIVLTAGQSLIMQVDTGATNNVQATVLYYVD